MEGKIKEKVCEIKMVKRHILHTVTVPKMDFE